MIKPTVIRIWPQFYSLLKFSGPNLVLNFRVPKSGLKFLAPWATHDSSECSERCLTMLNMALQTLRSDRVRRKRQRLPSNNDDARQSLRSHGLKLLTIFARRLSTSVARQVLHQLFSLYWPLWGFHRRPAESLAGNRSFMASLRECG
jgi:hypothetical protein